MILNNLIYRIFLSDFKENADGKPKYTIYSMEKRGAVSHIAAKINTKNKLVDEYVSIYPILTDGEPKPEKAVIVEDFDFLTPKSEGGTV